MINNDYGSTVTISPNIGGTPADTRNAIKNLLDSFWKEHAAKKAEHASLLVRLHALTSDIDLLTCTLEGLKQALSLGEDKVEESPRMAAYR